MGMKAREIVMRCAEYVDWMEKLGGHEKTTKTGKVYHYMLWDCMENKNGCADCQEDDQCMGCGIRLCVYLAKEADGEFICPSCWVSIGCPRDDRLEEGD